MSKQTYKKSKRSEWEYPISEMVLLISESVNEGTE